MKFSGMIYDQSFDLNGMKYQWNGGLGVQINGYENGVKKGDVKIIGDVMFYAQWVEKRWFLRDRIGWCMVGEVTAEKVRELKNQIFALDIEHYRPPFC